MSNLKQLKAIQESTLDPTQLTIGAYTSLAILPIISFMFTRMITSTNLELIAKTLSKNYNVSEKNMLSFTNLIRTKPIKNWSIGDQVIVDNFMDELKSVNKYKEFIKGLEIDKVDIQNHQWDNFFINAITRYTGMNSKPQMLEIIDYLLKKYK